MNFREAINDPRIRVGLPPIWSPGLHGDLEYVQQAHQLAKIILAATVCNAEPVSELLLGGPLPRRFNNEEFAPLYSPLAEPDELFIEAARPTRVTHSMAMPNEQLIYAPRFGWLIVSHSVAALRKHKQHPVARNTLRGLRQTLPDFPKLYADPRTAWVMNWVLLNLVILENGVPVMSGPQAYVLRAGQ